MVVLTAPHRASVSLKRKKETERTTFRGKIKIPRLFLFLYLGHPWRDRLFFLFSGLWGKSFMRGPLAFNSGAE